MPGGYVKLEGGGVSVYLGVQFQERLIDTSEFFGPEVLIVHRPQNIVINGEGEGTDTVSEAAPILDQFLTRESAGSVSPSYWNPDARLDSILAIARETLETSTEKTSTGAKIRNDARKLIFLVGTQLPDHRARGLLDAALVLALEIGRTFERIHARSFEPDVHRGKGTQKGSKKGGGTTHGKATTRAEQIRQAVRKRLEQNGGDSVTGAGEWVAEQHRDSDGKPQPGWSQGNIRRAIKGMKKSKTGRRKAAP